MQKSTTVNERFDIKMCCKLQAQQYKATEHPNVVTETHQVDIEHLDADVSIYAS